MFEIIKEIYEYREMLYSLVKRELRSRYKASFLGFLWTFITPLLQLAVYSLVFSKIFVSTADNFIVFIFTGLLPWNFFSSAINVATGSIVNNSNLVKKIYFPKIILPISVVCTFMMDYIFGLIILIPALFISKVTFTFNMLWFPVILLIQMLFTLGLSFALSAWFVKARDVQYLVSVIMMLWFYLTPILYNIDSLSDILKKILILNPLTSIIISYQNIFVYGKSPYFTGLLISCIISLVTFVIGIIIFKKNEKSFAEEL